MATLREKCVLLGNQGVGKTSLSTLFTSDGTQFPKTYSMTILNELNVKAVNIPNTNTSVELFIHDVAGHDVFLEYAPRYTKGASCFAIVYDISDESTFKAVPKWYAIAKKISEKPLKGVLIANKLDLDSRRVVTKEMGMQLAESLHLEYFETSAATNFDVEAPFYYMAFAYYEYYHQRLNDLYANMASV